MWRWMISSAWGQDHWACRTRSRCWGCGPVLPMSYRVPLHRLPGCASRDVPGRGCAYLTRAVSRDQARVRSAGHTLVRSPNKQQHAAGLPHRSKLESKRVALASESALDDRHAWVGLSAHRHTLKCLPQRGHGALGASARGGRLVWVARGRRGSGRSGQQTG